jgi:hypothetical protein
VTDPLLVWWDFNTEDGRRYRTVSSQEKGLAQGFLVAVSIERKKGAGRGKKTYVEERDGIRVYAKGARSDIYIRTFGPICITNVNITCRRNEVSPSRAFRAWF